MSKIGVIGLGTIGAPMTGRLLAGGHELHVFTIGAVPEALVGAKAWVPSTMVRALEKLASFEIGQKA